MKSAIKMFALLTVLMLCAGLLSAEGEYKKYTRPTEETVLMELTVTPTEWTFTVFDEDKETVYSFPTAEVVHEGGGVRCGDQITLTDEGIEIPNRYLAAGDIKRIDIKPGETSVQTVLSFIASDKSETTRAFKRKKSDRVSFFGGTTVEADEFIRGSVVAFFGDINVYGEVNEDVVAVLGDIYVDDGAVVRGDVVAVSGKVKLAEKASVYGLVRSSDGKKDTRRHRARRWKSRESGVGTTGALYYNRVDGLMLWGGAEYEHADSIIPSFEAMAGYAFAAERWRYRLSLTQTLVRGRVPIQVGGSLFRESRSGDDKLITESENTIFALLVNEDWKDYYESEGAYGFARVSALGWNEFEVGYLSEQQRWFDAHANLWSVFGDKEFRGNFSSVPYDTLTARKLQFNDRQITSLVLNYSIDTRDDEKRPKQGWYGFARYEFSPERWKGDFDFKRFEARLKRYQPLGRYISLDLTGAYGYAEGNDIPLSRMFYLGGLGTLHGYRHKEIIGTEYVLVSGEYRFRIPHSDIAPFVHYDGGRMMGDIMAGNDEWNSSIGIGVDIDHSLKLFLSKRLDVEGVDPVFYARFSAAVW